MSVMSRQAKLTLEELHALKWLLGNMLALLALWALSLLEFSGNILLVLGASLIALVLLMPRLMSRLPKMATKWIAPCILLFVLADFAVHLPNFLPPLVRMVTLLVLYRSLSPRRRREDLQLLLLALFCLIISGALTLSLLFALQILLFAPLGMALLFVICMLEESQGRRRHTIDWQTVRCGRIIRRVWGAWIYAWWCLPEGSLSGWSLFLRCSLCCYRVSIWSKRFPFCKLRVRQLLASGGRSNWERLAIFARIIRLLCVWMYRPWRL